jgi:demethylmenaquinone methyltransferase/2-methoxy-6-polyprenyl-1,4-benzoquinol methylase
MAWVIRNILNPANALTQLLSLLRPQGTIHILESGRPSAPIMKILYPVYSRIFPYLGSLVSPQKDFYEYYRRSVDAFPYHKQFITLLENSGYLHPHSTPILGGILYLYTAQAHTKNPQILPQRSSHTQSIDTP